MTSDWDPFGDLTAEQRQVIDEYERLVLRANRRTNLVSRNTERDFRAVHVRHSLMLAWRRFPTGSTVVDWGTGGGLPGIPLAIRFPDVDFVLIDSIGRKADMVKAIAVALGLPNVAVEHTRAEDWSGLCDYAVSRATAPLSDLWSWTEPRLRPNPTTTGEGGDVWMPGLLALKGGDLGDEIEDLKGRYPSVDVTVIPLPKITEGFADKSIIQVTR